MLKSCRVLRREISLHALDCNRFILAGKAKLVRVIAKRGKRGWKGHVVGKNVSEL